MLPYFEFDRKFFYDGIRALNQDAPIFEVSSKTGKGFSEFIKWLEEEYQKLKCKLRVKGVSENN